MHANEKALGHSYTKQETIPQTESNSKGDIDGGKIQGSPEKKL